MIPVALKNGSLTPSCESRRTRKSVNPDPTKSDWSRTKGTFVRDWLDIASTASCKGEHKIDPHPRTLSSVLNNRRFVVPEGSRLQKHCML
jgi:hypothetical protein